MLTGFNTDVEHDGVVYHVQTEDKGFSTPLILSLVYSGGAILASKRSPYQDLIDAGFDENVLAERLKRQHRLICAAIKAGRVEELKQMGAREAAEKQAATVELPPEEATAVIQSPSTVPASAVQVEELTVVPDAVERTVSQAVVAPSHVGEEVFEVLEARAAEEKLRDLSETEKAKREKTEAPETKKPEPARRSERGRAPSKRVKTQLVNPETPPPPTNVSPAEPTAYVIFDSRRSTPAETRKGHSGLCVTLVNEREFRSGEDVSLELIVTNRVGEEETPVSGASISFKVLGTTFRPVIVSIKTGKDGRANIKAAIPKFASGRAAILVRAAKGADSVEIRRVVYPGD